MFGRALDRLGKRSEAERTRKVGSMVKGRGSRMGQDGDPRGGQYDVDDGDDR